MRAVWTACVVLACAGRARAEPGGAEARDALAAGGLFSLQSTVLLNAAERRDRELGYRLEAELGVARADPGPAAHPDDILLCFTLSEPRLLVRRAHRSAEWERRGSVWDAAGAGGAWCARLRRGALAALLLPPADPPDVRDYKRALATLFQFRGEPGGARADEADPLGACAVSYEALGGGALRRVRHACAADAAAGVRRARRATRLDLRAGALHALHAEEVLELHAALKARSWHALRRAGPAPAPPATGHLADLGLPLDAAGDGEDDDDDDNMTLEEALEAGRDALEDEEAGAGGSVRGARALLALLPALRRAEQRALLAALERAPRPRRAGLCRALGLAGSAAAARAAAAFTRLAGDDPLEAPARAFLAGLALARAPERDAVLLAARLAADARRAPLADAALLAAAAAARAQPAAAAAVRDAVTRALARCRDAACRAPRLAALGDLRDGADALLASAEREEPAAAVAALAALRGAGALSPAQLARLARLARDVRRPLEVRAAALEPVVEARAGGSTAAVPLQLVELARALHAERSRAAHELRRVLWGRVRALRAAPAARALLAALPAELASWDARAHAGTSHVLSRDTGWGGGAGGWRATLHSLQLAEGGLLRRGRVALRLRPPPGEGEDEGEGGPPELEVEVWTRGLRALAGAGPEEAAEDGPEEGAAGGLALAVAGARLADITLFDGQAELLAHVWAGAGSAPTGVLRALRVAREARGALALLGGCTVRVRARAALALALDAHAAASLWHRTARAALELRAALAAEARARVRVAWGELRARRELAAEPRLRLALALDFYSGVAVCVRAAVPPHAVNDTLALRSELGARRLVVSRGAAASRPVAGRTLALGRDNDVACRTLHAADDDDD